ncbi:GTP-binding protein BRASSINAZOLE INSENSITIVE PALE GREEN 2, chloroplastic [Pistacia vera]|uniref:GTP-binding protein BRASSINAZOLE INSENSITIVE PALE GREEN 2, chloroplastic n=1 Tax=Pistacia vera TaxID=55513 RepID=UPI001263BB1A|nr:GTP-binding protein BRASSINAZOLE INSENSITIVE PALE GREEN 2, chloroplastic [Pistacia vera]
MLIRARTLSPSKLKPFFSQSLTQKIPRKSHLQNSLKPSTFQFFSLSPFSFTSSFSSSQQLPPSPPPKHLLLSRDGNYEEATPVHAVCPGCGVHMQDQNPKQPGYFIKPTATATQQTLHKIKTSHLVPVSTEPEFLDSVKRGNIVIYTDPETPNPKMPEKPVVCARCHGLRHYGRVKDPTVENLLPDFDFYHTVGRKLMTATRTRSVVLMVVDASDFDGSFPRRVAKIVSETVEENLTAWMEGKSGNLPRVVLVVTKIDLLPSCLSPTRFEHWVRQRAREGGIDRISKLHFVSAVKNWGLKSLIEDVTLLAGKRGNVWAIGAQNAGKSTLLNAIAKCVDSGGERGKVVSHLTEAPVPGTTLGIVRVEGVLPAQAKLFDTPGLLHPHQITTRLTREEQKLVHVSKELKPRTYRIKAGHSVHIAGLMRLDVEELSVESIYVTVWASPYLPLHMGKTENATRILEEHFCRQLQPPIGEKRVEELGKWVRKEFRVSGKSWDSSSVDIAAAGLGWFAIGLKGEAVLGVWTYEGVEIFLRNSLISDRSQVFEVAGFTVSKIVSKADQALNKPKRQSETKRKRGNPEGEIPTESSLLTVDSGSSS